MKVFALMEVFSGAQSSVVDIYKDWKQAEDARIGLELYKEHKWLYYEIIEWEVK